MLNKKPIKFSIVCLFGMLFAMNVMADNLSDKHVYSFYTENLNGATVDANRDYDNIGISVWSGGGDSQPAFPENDNSPVEGNKNYGFSCVGSETGWSGWCYTFKDASSNNAKRDISSFSTFVFYIRPKTGNVGSVKFGITAAISDTEVQNYTVSLASLGVDDSNKNWQRISVPISTFSGADLTKVQNVFLFLTDKITASFDVDYMIMKKSGSGSFDATLKTRDGKSSSSQITWDNSGSSSVFRNGWQTANQYIELSLDDDLTTATDYNWTVRVYTNNGAASKNGLLYASDETKVLPMGWRCSKRAIPYHVSDEDEATLSIGEDFYTVGTETKGRLYDSGVSVPHVDYNTWFYFVDYSRKSSLSSDELDYVTAWSNKGFHAAAGANYWGMGDMQFDGIYPRIYLGANFATAVEGSYSSKIIVELSYDE